MLTAWVHLKTNNVKMRVNIDQWHSFAMKFNIYFKLYILLVSFVFEIFYIISALKFNFLSKSSNIRLCPKIISELFFTGMSNKTTTVRKLYKKIFRPIEIKCNFCSALIMKLYLISQFNKSSQTFFFIWFFLLVCLICAQR